MYAWMRCVYVPCTYSHSLVQQQSHSKFACITSICVLTWHTLIYPWVCVWFAWYDMWTYVNMLCYFYSYYLLPFEYSKFKVNNSNQQDRSSCWLLPGNTVASSRYTAAHAPCFLQHKLLLLWCLRLFSICVTPGISRYLNPEREPSLLCTKTTFFTHWYICLSRSGSFLVHSAAAYPRDPREHTAHVWVPAEVRNTSLGGSKSRKVASNYGIRFRRPG